MALQPTDYENDWLYGRKTPICDESLEYDSFPSDLANRIIMGMIWVGSMLTIMAMPRIEGSSEVVDKGAGDKSANDKFMSSPSPSGGRWVFLDVVRIAAVTCVVTEHGGGNDYSRRNVLFTAQWTLASLFLTSGIAYMFSRSKLLPFIGRLLMVFLIGFAFNAFADSFKRPGWYCDVGNTIYQMFYVVAISGLSILVYPLRMLLREQEHATGSKFLGMPVRMLWFMLYFGIWFVWMVTYLFVKPDFADMFPRPEDDDSGDNLGDSLPDHRRLGALIARSVARRLQEEAVADFCTDTSELVGNETDAGSGVGNAAMPGKWGDSHSQALAQLPFFIAHVLGLPALLCFYVLMRRKPNGTFTWLAVAYIYLPAVLFPIRLLLMTHACMIYLLGFIHQAQPLYGSEKIASVIRAYWLFYIVFLLFLYQPPLLGRCDLYPALTTWERFRWFFPEASLMVLILTRTFEATDPYGIVAILSWWSLFAYVSHVAFIRLVPEPWGVCIVYAFIPVFFLTARAMRCITGRKAGQSDEEEGKALPTEGSALLKNQVASP